MSKFARMMLSALALLACTAHAQNAPSYRAVKFDAQFRPHILNDVGQVAGMGQDGRPAIWNPDGSILQLPGAASEVTITGFNNQGTVVGNALIPGYSLPQPVVWRNGGSVERLPFTGLGGYTEGINNRGDIIGYMAGASDTGTGQVGFIQWGDGSTPQLFDDYKPQMINDHGLVLGQRSDAWGLRSWQDGVFGDTLIGDGLYISGLNNEGHMSGSHAATEAYWIIERDGQFDARQLWSGSTADINDADGIVGFTEWSNHAMLWFDGRAYVLDHLWHDAEYSGWSLLNAWDINASGAILANGFGNGDAAFLLSPVPEPGGAIMLLAGLMLLALHRLAQRKLFARAMSCSLLALLTSSAYAQEAPAYRATRFDGSFMPKFLNDAGQVAGISQDGKVVIWSPDGSVVRLPGVVNDLSITGFNSQGTVIGNGLIPGFSKPQALMWRNGGAMELVQIAGAGGVAAGINNRGDIVGYNFDPRTGNEPVGFIQWADGSAPQLFGDYRPTIINDLGMVLGNRSDEFGTRSWRDGVFGDDRTPYDFYARALNSEGRRVGYQENAYAYSLLVRGAERDYRQLWSRYAFDINDAGSVVGETAYERAMLLYQDRPYVLDHLWNEEPYAGWFLESAWDINAGGQILARGGNEWDQYATFLLSPVPEPAQGALLLAGLALLGSWRLRSGRRSA
jgi:hypothetical protein